MTLNHLAMIHNVETRTVPKNAIGRKIRSHGNYFMGVSVFYNIKKLRQIQTSHYENK